MTTKEIIEQLESLKENSRSFLDENEPDSVWHHDIEALEAAIAIIQGRPMPERKMRGMESRLHRHGKRKPRCRKRKGCHI